jgi:hypothetical protein
LKGWPVLLSVSFFNRHNEQGSFIARQDLRPPGHTVTAAMVRTKIKEKHCISQHARTHTQFQVSFVMDAVFLEIGVDTERRTRKDLKTIS